jgi:hypothetical protein
MTIGIRFVMRQCAQSESIFIDVSRIVKQGHYEIAAPYIVDQIAEILAAERVVAEILDDTTAVGVGMGFGELFFGEFRKSLEEKWTKRVLPEKIDDFFMSEDGIGKRAAAG